MFKCPLDIFALKGGTFANARSMQYTHVIYIYGREKNKNYIAITTIKKLRSFYYADKY